MSLRLLKLPDDLLPMGDMMKETFQYPDHPEWSVQTDEVESIVASMKNYRRMWPLIRLLQWLSPALRDILHGHVWEEEGQIAGFTNVNRRGTTDVWYVSGVGVRPSYRRRGIARQMLRASLDLMREHGGRIILLDVIDGNIPAYQLYQSLGLETYTGMPTLELDANVTVASPDLPEGYTHEIVSLFEWQSRYELDRRITPEHVLPYEPVEPQRYQKPPLARLMMPLLMKADGIKPECFIIRSRTGKVVAFGRGEVRVREKGRHEIYARLDPAHAELAPYLIQTLSHRVLDEVPGRIVEMWLPQWQSALVEAAKQVGFKQRLLMHRMGKTL